MLIVLHKARKKQRPGPGAGHNAISQGYAQAAGETGLPLGCVFFQSLAGSVKIKEERIRRTAVCPESTRLAGYPS